MPADDLKRKRRGGGARPAWRIAVLAGLFALPCVPAYAWEDAPPPKVVGAGVWAVDANTGRSRLVFELDQRLTDPAAADGLLMVGTDEGVLAFDPQTGAAKWQFDGIGWVADRPAVRGQTVFVAAKRRSTIYALDAQSGKLRWNHDLGERRQVAAPLSVAGDALLVGTSGKDLLAFEASSGRQLWQCYLGSTPRSIACTADGVVYVKSFWQIDAVELESGKRTRLHVNPAANDGSAPTVADGVLYFTDPARDHHAALAMDLKTRETSWKRSLGPGAESPVVVGPLVLFPVEHHLYAVDRKTGEVQWSLLVGSGARKPTVLGDRAYCANLFGRLFCADVNTGKQLWACHPPDDDGPLVDQHCALHGPLCVVGGTIYLTRLRLFLR